MERELKKKASTDYDCSLSISLSVVGYVDQMCVFLSLSLSLSLSLCEDVDSLSFSLTHPFIGIGWMVGYLSIHFPSSFSLSIPSVPILFNPIWSGPTQSNPIQSDPIQSDPFRFNQSGHLVWSEPVRFNQSI